MLSGQTCIDFSNLKETFAKMTAKTITFKSGAPATQYFRAIQKYNTPS